MKTGLVLEGGGMKCAFCAGILDRFLDEGITFDYVIGVSAGAGNAASFLAGQRDRNRRFYTDYIDDPRYMSLQSFLKTGNYFGIQFIYAEMSNEGGVDPLDYDAMMENPAEFCIVATDAKTGRPHYFYKNEIQRNNYKQIMASVALPGISKPVEIDGRYYYDGGVSDSVPARQAFKDGCDRVVVILSKPRDYVPAPEKHKLLLRTLCHRFPATLKALDERHIMVSERLRFVKKAEEKKKAYVFAPVDPPAMSTYAKDKELEWKLYELGLKQYDIQADELKSFLKGQEI